MAPTRKNKKPSPAAVKRCQNNTMAMIKAKEPKVGNIGPFGKRMTKKNVNMAKKGTKKVMKLMDPLKMCAMSQEERKEYAKKALGKIFNMALR